MDSHGGSAQATQVRTRASSDGPALSERALLLIVAAVSAPLLWMGYGTDIDVGNVLHTTDMLRDGDYEPSRTPGVPVVEAITAVLEPIGGHILVNLATAAAGALTILGIVRLVRAWGHDNGELVALAFFASPVTIIASTSLADFMWALAFFVWAALAQLRNRPVLAGLLFGLSIGCRLSTGFLFAAFLVADGWDPAHRRRGLQAVAVALPVGAALYIPAWLWADRSLHFLETEDGWRGLLNNLGRFAYKNYATAGVALIIVFAVAAPALVAATRRWGRDPMLRFALLSFIVTQLLFFQLPWKVAHLLPALLAAMLWLAVATPTKRFWWVVVGAMALNGIVSLRLMAPDNPHEATGGRWNPSVGAGLLANDIDCRVEFMDDEPPVARGRDVPAWDCTLKPVNGAG